MRVRTMRAYANARIRIALHAKLRTHFSCVMRAFAYVIWRLPCPLCAHSHAMRAHSHRMRSHSHRMRSHRMRMRAFKGNLCVSGTVYLSQKWSDCHETKSKHIDWTLGFKWDHRVWPWPWPWPWIFKVKYGIGYISAKNDLIATKRKANTSIEL